MAKKMTQLVHFKSRSHPFLSHIFEKLGGFSLREYSKLSREYDNLMMTQIEYFTAYYFIVDVL